VQPEYDVAVGKRALLQAKAFPNNPFDGVPGHRALGLFLANDQPKPGLRAACATPGGGYNEQSPSGYAPAF